MILSSNDRKCNHNERQFKLAETEIETNATRF